LSHDADAPLDHLLGVEDAHLILSHCRLSVPPASGNGDPAFDLISFRAVTSQPVPTDSLSPYLTPPVDRPVCRLVDCVLITNGTALKAELGRGLVAFSQCAVAAGDTALELVPSKVARWRFEVELWLDQCTLVAERSIVHLGTWPGLAPGPDQPWLVTSSNCAFLSLSDRRAHESVLLRGDPDALACGTLFWQGVNDAVEVDPFTAAGDSPPSVRGREIALLWRHFWGSNHISMVSGPRGSVPSVQFLERPRPGRVEASDLVLDPAYHPGRNRLTVGADLSRQGITPRSARPGRRAN
jgi:serine/threonine-protein kinase